MIFDFEKYFKAFEKGLGRVDFSAFEKLEEAPMLNSFDAFDLDIFYFPKDIEGFLP